MVQLQRRVDADYRTVQREVIVDAGSANTEIQKEFDTKFGSHTFPDQRYIIHILRGFDGIIINETWALNFEWMLNVV